MGEAGGGEQEGGIGSLASVRRRRSLWGSAWGWGMCMPLCVCVFVFCVCVCVCARAPAASGRQPLRSGRNHTINNSRCGVSLRAQKDCDSVTWPGQQTRSFLPHDTRGWGQQSLFHKLPGQELLPLPLLKPPRLFPERLEGSGLRIAWPACLRLGS